MLPTASHAHASIVRIATAIGCWCAGSSLGVVKAVTSYRNYSAAIPSEDQTEEKAASAGLKRESGTGLRYYKNVGVQERQKEGGWGVTLNNKQLNTPAKQPLVVPSQALALAIAAEFEYQDKKTVRPFTMPLMALASTAIDMPRSRSKVMNGLLHYMHGDVVCHRDQPGELADLQSELHDPVIRWAEQFLDTKFSVSESLFGSRHDLHAEVAVRQYLEGLDRWELTSVDSLSATLKSVILGIAVKEGHVCVDDASRLARVEEDSQIQEWGFVEGGHDIDIAHQRVQLLSAVVFLRMTGPRHGGTCNLWATT